jgi:Tfp pilus assembly protein PilN
MQSVNLLPPNYARQERAKRRLLISVAVVVAFVLALFGCARLIGKRVAAREQAQAELLREVDDLDTCRRDLADARRQARDAAKRLSVLLGLDRNRRWATRLARIADAATTDVVLTRVQIEPVRPKTDDSGRSDPRTPPAAKPAAGTSPQREPDLTSPESLVLRLEGYATGNTEVTRFITSLSRTGLFERVHFKGSESARVNEVALSRFELECPIRDTPAQPAQPPAPAPALSRARTTEGASE